MSIRSLTDEQITEMRILYIDHKYTLKQLSTLYKCSVSTISLWLPIDSIGRINKFTNKKQHQQCSKCGVPFKTHNRCKICTILLHDNQCDCI